MKHRLMAVLLLALAAVSLGAAGAPPADIATELDALRAILAERTARAGAGQASTPSASTLWMADHMNRLGDSAVRIYESHPGDPRRWEAGLIALQTMRSFIVELKPGYDEAVAARNQAQLQALIVRDEAARAAWDRQLDGIEAALFAATDVPAAILSDAYANAVYRVSLRRGLTPAARWAAMEPLIAAMERRVADPVKLTRAYEIAMRSLQAADPAGYTAFLQERALSPIPEVSRWAAGKANLEARKVEAVEMKFTAIDVREVDLAQLRGKVVLIDFWATWCGPCKEELPNVLENYRKYHELGFEVVGVSLDHAKDRQKLIDYTREQGLPWPQHFDGQGFKNQFATQFSIRAIPAMFLLDQAGRVASTEARGAKLEPEIRRLLKLDPVAPVPKESASAPVPAMLGPGALAPDFVTRDLAGNEVRVSDYRGKVLILDFWATWCGPCVASMPHTQEIAAKYSDQGVAVLAVCTGDKRGRFEDWVTLKARNYPAIRFSFDPHEQGTAAEAERASVALYRVPAIPTQFIINREGRIVGTTTGYRQGDTTLERALAAAGVKADLPPAAGKPSPPMVGSVVRAADGTTTQLRTPSGVSPAEAAPAGPRPPVAPFRDNLAKVKAGDLLVDVEFRAADGTPRKLSDYRGKPLVLLFAPAEMIPEEYLNGMVEQYGPAGVQVLALVTRDTEANYQAWLDLHGPRGNRFATAFDPVPISDPRNGVINRIFQFGAPTPFSMVVDAEGRFVGLFPWKLPQGQQGLAELLRRCGVTVAAGKSAH
jgi:peroxiredoxin